MDHVSEASVANVDGAALEVEVAPAESEQFTEQEAGVDRDGEKGTRSRTRCREPASVRVPARR
jgi:hypothetical protein